MFEKRESGVRPLRMMREKNAEIRPAYYRSGIEAIEYIESHNMDFAQGNIVKYVTRYKGKNGLEDLIKARYYIDRLIARESKK